jgi:hypothetical protein
MQPRKPDQVRRNKQASTFLNEKEIAALDAKAETEGLSRSDIIRLSLKPIFEEARSCP